MTTQQKYAVNDNLSTNINSMEKTADNKKFNME